VSDPHGAGVGDVAAALGAPDRRIRFSGEVEIALSAERLIVDAPAT